MKKKRAKKKVHEKKVCVHMSAKAFERLQELLRTFNLEKAIFGSEMATILQEQQQIVRLLAMMQMHIEKKREAATEIEKLLDEQMVDIRKILVRELK